MHGVIDQFIEAMRAAGCGPLKPSEIVANDKRNRYAVEGDRGKTRTGIYQLKVNAEGWGVGWFRNYRIGETHKWNSKASKKFSAEEVKAYREKIEAEKKAQEEARAREIEAVAAKAEKLWAKAAPATGTPYTERKGIKPMGARQSGDLLIVPIRKKDRLMSLQYIAPDGSKRFLTGGDVAGGYCALAEATDDFSVILICEGYATGKTIRDATGRPVIATFNAGNLAAAAKEIRLKRPKAKLIICADSDQWVFRPGAKPDGIEARDVPGDDPRWATWREANRLLNVGVEKARECASAIRGAYIVAPDVPGNDLKKRTDFNDVGVEETRRVLAPVVDRALGNIPEELEREEDDTRVYEPTDGPDLDSVPAWMDDQPPPLEAYNEEAREVVSLYAAGEKKHTNEWRDKLRYTDKGKMDSASMENADLFIKNDAVLGDLFCYDEFSNQKMIYRCPPWEKAENFKPHAVRDNDITYLAIELEKRGLKLHIGTIQRILDAAIKSRPRNPAAEYFNRLEWDGVKRLDTWLQKYAGATFDPEEYVSAVGRKWLCAGIARVLNPGCKFDYMPIFEGPQGLRKSGLLKELATIHGTIYFDDTIKVRNLGDDKTIPKMQGVLIIEIADMAGLGMKDVDDLKAEMTVTVDRLVMKYQNEASSFPRKFILGGTFNPKPGIGYLADPTGARRFWPIKCSAVTPEGKVDIKGLSAVKEQLWAEAKVMYDAGEPLYLSPELEAIAFDVQEQRSTVHPWEGEIELICKEMNSISYAEIWSGLKIDDRTKRSKKSQGEVSEIMTRLGYEYKQLWNGGERDRKWVRRSKIVEIKI